MQPLIAKSFKYYDPRSAVRKYYTASRVDELFNRAERLPNWLIPYFASGELEFSVDGKTLTHTKSPYPGGIRKYPLPNPHIIFQTEERCGHDLYVLREGTFKSLYIAVYDSDCIAATKLRIPSNG